MAKRYIPGSITPTGALTPEQQSQMEEDLLLQREEAEQAVAERQLPIAQPAAPLEMPVEEDPLESVRAALSGQNFQTLDTTQQSRIVPGAEPVAGIMPDITTMQAEEGEVLPTEQGRERYQEEVTEQAAESLYRTVPVDFQTEDELKQITKEGMRPTATGALFHMRLPLTKSLSEGRVNRQDGLAVSNMEVAADLLGTTDYNRVLNAGVMSFTRLGVMALKQKEFDSEANSMFDTIEEFNIGGLMESPIDQQIGEASKALQEGGVEANTFVSMLGKSLYETVHPTPLNEFGLPTEAIVPYNESNAFKASQIITQALVDNGYLIEETRTTTPLPKGQNLEDQTAPRTKNPKVKVYLAGPKSRRMIMGAKDYLLSVDPNELPTRSQLVPASKKGFVGARSELMGQDLAKGATDRLPKALENYKLNLGSVAVQYDRRRLNALNFINLVASDGNFAEQYPQFAPIADNLLDIDRNKILAGDPEALNAEETNRRTRKRTINYAKNISADGRSRYLPYKVDRSVNRAYPVSDDFNPQSYTHIRQIMTFVNRPLITVTKLGRRDPSVSLLSDSEIPNVGNLEALKSLSQNEMNELDLLFSIESALSSTASRHLPERTLADITENKLRQYAEIGGLLKTIFETPNVPNAFMGLPPESQEKLMDVFKSLNHKNWGMRTSAYMAAHSYVNQSQLNDSVLLEADQRSAGRTFLAMDIGETQVLKRTGIFYGNDSEFTEGSFDVRTLDFLADGTPRTYFAAEAEHVFEDYFDSVQGKEGRAYNHGGTIRATVSDLLETRPKFADDFGKKVLMVTDYGKAISAHKDAGRALLGKYPELFEAFNAEGYDTEGASIVLAEVFKDALARVTDSAQRNVPSAMALIQGFLGTKPRPIGYFGETIPFGKQKLVTRKSGLMTSTGLDLMDVSREEDFAARGVTKTFKDKQDDGTIKKTTYVPNAYTAVTNMVGPVKGQYRETVVNVESYNGLTELIGEPANAVPVHDNFIMSNKNLLMFTYFMNEVGTRKALDWNMHAAMEKDFTESINQAAAEMPNEIRMEEGSDFYGFLQYMDEQVDFLENRIKNPDDDTILPSLKQGNFVKKVEAIIEAAKDELGYEDYRTRENDVLVVSKEQYLNFIRRYYLNDKAFKNQRASLFTRSNDSNSNSDRSIVMDAVKKQKRLGFMIPNADG